MQAKALRPRRRWIACLTAAAFGLLAAGGWVFAQSAPSRGVALILSDDGGGSAPEATADAAAMAQALGGNGLGYQVVKAANPTRDDLIETKGLFLGKLDGASVAVIYYAGYGVRVNGADYIIPSGAHVTSPSDVASQAYDLDVLVTAAKSKAADVVVLLDACRSRAALQAIGVQCLGGSVRGRDQIYSLAAGPRGSTVMGGKLSAFTERLAATIVPGLTVRQIFSAVTETLADSSVDLPFVGDPVLAAGVVPSPERAEAKPPPERAPPPPPPKPKGVVNMVTSDEINRRFKELVGKVADAHNLFDDGDVDGARARAADLLAEATALRDLDPKFKGLHREFGRLAMIRGDYLVAIAEYEAEKAERVGEGATSYVGFLNYLLGTAYLRADRIPEAIELLGAATFAENGGDAYVKNAARRSARLGEAYRKAHRLDEAKKALDDANGFSQDIDNASAHLQLAYVYLEQGLGQEAFNEAGRTVEHRKGTPSRGGLAEAYAAAGRARLMLFPNDEATAWEYVQLARAEDPQSPEASALAARLPPFAARPVFRDRPIISGGLKVIEDAAQSCYALPEERNAYLDGIKRETAALEATLVGLDTYMKTLGAQEEAYRARGYQDFHPNFIREFNYWTSRYRIIQNRSNQLGGVWFPYVLAHAGDCGDVVPARLEPPAGYNPRQYLLTRDGDPEAGAPPPAGPPPPPAPIAEAAPPPKPPPPAPPPEPQPMTTAAAAPVPSPPPAVQAPPAQALPSTVAPPPASPPAANPVPVGPPPASPPVVKSPPVSPPPTPAPVRPAQATQQAPTPTPTPAPASTPTLPPAAPVAPPPPAPPVAQTPAKPKTKTPPEPPPPSGYELARRKPPPGPAPAPPPPVVAAAAPAPQAPPRAVIDPGILTARTVFDPLPVKPLKPAEQQAVRATMEQARQALTAGKFPDADALFGKVIDGDPGNVTGLLAEAHLGRGKARRAQGQDATAKDDFDFVVERRLGPNPVLALAAIERGKLLMAHDALTPAAQSFDLAVVADPRNPEGHYLRGVLLLKAGNVASAREAFEAAINVKLDYAEANAGLGDIYFGQGEYQKAADAYGKALSGRGDLWLAGYGRARALYQAQQFEPAMQAFQALIAVPRPPEIGKAYDAALYCGVGASRVGMAWASKSRDDWLAAGTAFDQAGLAQAPGAQIKAWKGLVDFHRKVDSTSIGRLAGEARASQVRDQTATYMSPASLAPAQACVAPLAR